MKTLQICAAAGLSAAISMVSVLPANTAPVYLPKSLQTQDIQRSDVIQVRDGWRRGYRGYRYHRPGYRYDNGWWFPAGAFVAGAVIGGAFANSYDYDPYYGDRYYGGGYYPEQYYPRRVYNAPPGAAYRQGYRDGYRAGRSERYYGGYPCSPRLSDAGTC